MSVRIRPLRTLIGQRGIHTSSCLLQSESSTPVAPPKPKSFTDLGFGTSHINRTRDLPRLDLGSIGGDINVKTPSDRRPQLPRQDHRSNQMRPRNDKPRQNNSPRASRPAASAAPADPTSTTDFFEHSKESEMSARSTAPTSGRRKQAVVDMSLIDMDANVISPPGRGTGQSVRPPRDQARASGQSNGPRGDRGPNQRSPSGNRFEGQRGSSGQGGPGAFRRTGASGGLTAGQSGPGGAAGGARGKGGRRKRGDNDRPEKNDDAALRALRQQWEGAPIIPQEVEVNDTALFGASSILSKNQLLVLTKDKRKIFEEKPTDATNYRSTTVRLPQNRPARSLSNVGTKEQNVLRLVGDLSYRLPTSPVPSDPSLQKNKKAFMKSTFEWQMALQQNLAPAHIKQIKAASDIMTKVLA